jgi:hypothetical protein
MHNCRVVFACKDVSRPAHVCGKLIYLVDAVENLTCVLNFTKIARDKVIGV